jgi:hypothetical protein
MDLSLAGLIGAMIGALAGAVNAVPLVAYADRAMRARRPVQTLEQRAAFEGQISLVRRTILGIDIAICAGVGYWFGKTMGG